MKEVKKPYPMPKLPPKLEGKTKKDLSGNDLDTYKSWMKQCGLWLEDLRVAAGLVFPEGIKATAPEKRKWEYTQASDLVFLSHHSWEKFEKGQNPIPPGIAEYFCFKVGEPVEDWCGWKPRFAPGSESRAMKVLRREALMALIAKLDGEIGN